MDRGDVACIFVSAMFGLVLMGCYGAGRLVRPLLPPHHRSREATEVLLAVIAMLVTFSAIVLGLMLNSSLEKLDHLNELVGGLADRIVRLDDTLVEYGGDGQLAHVALVNYTRRETVGLSDAASSPLTRAALQQIGASILMLRPPDAYHATMKHDALERFNDVVDLRFRALTEGNKSPNLPFDCTLGFWLALTYFVFGLNSERNIFILTALGLSMLAIIAAIFVILDMDTALGGIISVSKEPLRHALAAIG